MEYKTNIVEVNGALKKIEITVGSKELDKRIEEEFRNAAKTVSLKGFRKGKAPRNMLERFYGDSIRKRAIAEIMEELGEEVIKDNGLSPVVPATLEPGEYEKGKDYTFTAHVEVLPKVELGEYKGIEVERPEMTVSEEEVNSALDELASRHAEYKRPEPARLPVKGDMLLVSFHAINDNNGEILAKYDELKVELETGNLPEDVEKALYGAMIGDKKSVKVSYSEDEDHGMAGKTVKYDVELKDMWEKIMPALDDEFAEDLGKDSLETLKNEIQDEIERMKKTIIDNKAKDKIMGELLERHPIDLPPSLVEAQKNTLLEEIKGEYQARGRSFDELRYEKEALQKARERVHGDIIIDAVAEAENIEASDDDVDERIREIAQARGHDFDKLKDTLIANNGMATMKYQIKNALTLDFLLGNANIIKGEEAEK